MLTALQAPAAALLLAAFGSCDTPPPPAVHFQFGMQPPPLYRDKDSGDLEAMRGVAVQGGGHVGGLTRAELSHDVSMTIMERENIMGGVCVWPAEITIRLELQPAVWLASEYAPGSCRYNVAYVHEMVHVKIARDTLAEFMPGIEQLARATAQAIGVMGPMAQADVRRAQDAMLAQVNGMLSEAVQRVHLVLEGRQAAIDTQESYEQAARVCAGEPQWGRR